MASSLPRIGISLGVPSGVGLEVTYKALSHPSVRRALTPVLFGDASAQRAGAELRVVSQLPPKHRLPGKPCRAGGLAQLAYVQAVIAAAQLGELDALCPRLCRRDHHPGGNSSAAIPSSGDLLRRRGADAMRAAAVGGSDRNHLALRQVPDALSIPKLVTQLQLLDRELGAPGSAAASPFAG